jgi:hypothetical protein
MRYKILEVVLTSILLVSNKAKINFTVKNLLTVDGYEYFDFMFEAGKVEFINIVKQ